MTPTLKTFVLNKMRAYLCSKMFLCAIENALGLLVSCLKNRPIFYKNIGAYTDGLLLKNIFIGLYIKLSVDACKLQKKIDVSDNFLFWQKDCSYWITSACQMSLAHFFEISPSWNQSIVGYTSSKTRYCYRYNSRNSHLKTLN